jgi:hypothetical protein
MLRFYFILLLDTLVLVAPLVKYNPFDILGAFYQASSYTRTVPRSELPLPFEVKLLQTDIPRLLQAMPFHQQEKFPCQT